MANDEVRIKIRIDSNSQELVLMKQQVQNLGNSFNKTDSIAATFNSKLDALNGKVYTMGNSFNKADSVASVFTNRIIALGGAYLSLNTAINAGKMFITQADSMNLLDSRLKLATTSTAEYLSEQKKITQISLDAHTAISDTTTLFTKLNPALKQVGANTNQVNSVVGSFTEGLQLGGATAEETKSSILQFSQAMGSGVLRGEEFNAMAEASPKLLEYMAKGLGVPQTALRKMAEEGELTAVKVSNALLSVKTDIDRDFKTMPLTVGKAMTDFSTYMSLGINDIDKATGASTALSGAILDFGKNIGDISGSVITFYQDAVNFTKNHNEALDTTGTILKTVTTAYIGFAVTSGIATGIGAITTSVYALRTSILLLETSIPVIGWVAAAVGTAAGAYVLANDMMDESNNRASMGITELKKKIEELQKRRDGLEQNKYTDSNTKTINDQIEALQSKLRIQEKIKQNENQRSSYIFPKEEESSVTKLIDGYNSVGLEYSKTVELITEKKKSFTDFTQEIQKQIDPVRAIHEEYKKLRKSIKGTEADTPEYNKNLNQKELDDIAKLDKEKVTKAKETAKKIAEVEAEFALVGLDEWDTKFQKLDSDYKADLVKYQDVIGSKEKLDSVYKDKALELTNQKNAEIQKSDLSYYERKVQLTDNTLQKELELQGVAYSTKILDIESTTKSIAEKDKLIAKETELYNATVQNLTYKDNQEFDKTMSDLYDNMLESQLSINDALFNFNDGLDSSASKIATVAQKMGAMDSLNLTNKKEAKKLDDAYIEQFVKYTDDIPKTKELAIQYEKDEANLKEKNLQSQLIGYASIGDAISRNFAQGSRDAATFQLAENALTLTAGARAIISQGTGDPYTAFARMAMMAVTVKSLLGNIGLAFGMGGTSSSSDAFSLMAANNGSGSTLGDSKASSKSITDSLSILKDFAKPEYDTLTQMNKYLASIDQKIGGVSSLLIQNGGFAFGAGYTGFDTGYKNNIGTNNTTGALLGGAGVLSVAGMTGGFGAMGALSVAGPAGLALMAVDKLLLGGVLTKTVGGIVNTALGGIFGKTSVSQSLTDSGIYFADTLLTSAIKEFDGQAYQTISTTTSSKSWFSSSSSTSISSYFDELDAETERQFSLVLDN